MTDRHFKNKSPGEDPAFSGINQSHVLQLVTHYVNDILARCPAGGSEDRRGDLYVGDSGIAFMFLQMHLKSAALRERFPCIEYAKRYVESAKVNARRYSKRADERCAFLLGNAGIYATAAVIAKEMGKQDDSKVELEHFALGFDACKPIHFNQYGSDEVLVGRAGFLGGVYWLNSVLGSKAFANKDIVGVCEAILASGREYSEQHQSRLPLMYAYHGSEYLGAAHGVCAILLVLLQSPWFEGDRIDCNQKDLSDIRRSIDEYLSLQDAEGNFPIVLDDLREKRLVHWCHGAPGAIYLFAKAYLIFKENKYLEACTLAADLIWRKGLLKKGPGICHGIAGNGYAFLLMYRLTNDTKYLYRAAKFMSFLQDPTFLRDARTPDNPYSLYEGTAGTVCFLVDLLEPQNASFPFMNVFD